MAKGVGSGLKKGMESAKLEATLWGSAEHAAHMAEYAAGAPVRASVGARGSHRLNVTERAAAMAARRGRYLETMRHRAGLGPRLFTAGELIKGLGPPPPGSTATGTVTRAGRRGPMAPGIVSSVPPEQLDRGNSIAMQILFELKLVNQNIKKPGVTLKTGGIA